MSLFRVTWDRMSSSRLHWGTQHVICIIFLRFLCQNDGVNRCCILDVYLLLATTGMFIEQDRNIERHLGTNDNSLLFAIGPLVSEKTIY